MSHIVAAVGFVLFALLVASVVLRRTAEAEPSALVDSDCTGPDCALCAHLMRHPSQAKTRQVLARAIPRQTRGGGSW